MNVLLLGPPDSPVRDVLAGENVTIHTDQVTSELLLDVRPGVLVAYRYRHIVPKWALDLYDAVNLHPSYLPWNRGADPNYWSFIDDTPKGVTVHWMDEHLDTGPIIAQRRIEMPYGWTIDEFYEHLRRSVVLLFGEVWSQIKAGTAPRIPQQPGGSYHRLADREHYERQRVAGAV